MAAAERWAKGEEPHPKRKQKTLLEQVQHLWTKADNTERKKIKEWVIKQLIDCLHSCLG